MKVWIFILVVLASASSIVNARIAAPGAVRSVAMQNIGLD